MRTRNSHRLVTVWESYYDDYDNLIDEELIDVQKEWRKHRHGENRSQTHNGRIYRQHAPYHDDPVIWTLMDMLPSIFLIGMAVQMCKCVTAQPKEREVTQ